MGNEHPTQPCPSTLYTPQEVPTVEQRQDTARTTSQIDDTKRLPVPCELPQGVSGLGINLTVSVPKNTTQGYISYQADGSPPDLPVLAALLEHVLFHLAFTNELPSVDLELTG